MDRMSREAEEICCGRVEQIDSSNKIERSYALFVGDDFFIGREEDCRITFHDPTISNYHVRIYVIGFDDNMSDIAPLVYAQDMSRNGTVLVCSADVMDPKFDASGRTLTKTDPAYLIADGDELHLNQHAVLKFRLPGSGRVCISARERVRGPEKKLFEHLYSITRRKIGEGGFGVVHLAFDRDSKSQLACKIIDIQALRTWVQERRKGSNYSGRSQRNPYPLIKQEVEILFELNHPNILSIEGVFFSESTAYIFTELVRAGDLMSYVQHRGGGQLDDIGTAVIVRQVLKAVEYLQGKRIVHRDLKPENILLTSLSAGARIVVSDFGHARYLPGGSDSQSSVSSQAKLKRMFSLVGTAEYAAPEMYPAYISMNTQNGYSDAIDMWSIGTITALLLSGRQPFGLENDSRLPEFEREKLIRENARNCNLESLNASEGWKRVGPRAKDFVMRLLAINEERRPTAKQALQHPWFSNSRHRQEFDDLYKRATNSWIPRPKGRRRLVDLGLIRRNQTREDIPAQQILRFIPTECLEEDEFSRDDETPACKS